MTLPLNLTKIFSRKHKSYKMVLILSLLQEIEQRNHVEAPLAAVRERFLRYLQQREQANIPVDSVPAHIGARWSALSENQIQQLILTPIEALSDVLTLDRASGVLSFRPEIQQQWSQQLAAELKAYAETELEQYNQALSSITALPLREYLQEIMDNYLIEKRNPFAGNALGQTVRNSVPLAIKQLPFIDEQLQVNGSVGMGNWATIPWIAIMHPTITNSTQRGEYIVYLFAEDMQSVYLTLAQGVTEPKNRVGKRDAYSYLQSKVRELRSLLPLEGMTKDENIHLTDQNGLGRDYQVSTVAYYRYDRDNLPSNEQLIGDLANVVENYSRYVEYVQSHGGDEVAMEGTFPFTIAHLYLGQGILHYLRQLSEGSASLGDLTSMSSQVLRKGEDVKHPKERIQHICRALHELGLLTIASHEIKLTELGKRYGESFNTAELWEMTPAQIGLLRREIEANTRSTPLMMVIREAIAIAKQLESFTLAAFTAPFISYLGMQDEWGEVTQKNRARFMLNWLEELAYLARDREQYEFLAGGEPQLLMIEDQDVQDRIQQIQSSIRSRGFSYPEHLVENFYLSLKTKPFVILAGISGTGKTKLVQLFAEAVGATEENGQFTLIPVRPDWSDPSDLIGYVGLSESFRMGKLTKVLLEASHPANRHKPYFICLDEMNLARVEHYFSDILSILETQRWRDGEIVTDAIVPADSLNAGMSDPLNDKDLYIPDNVFIIGTVNMDETTYPFSKKVLDRANTLEFNYIRLQDYAASSESSELQQLERLSARFLRSDYLQLKEAYADHTELVQRTTKKLVEVNAILEEIHSHIGFRVRDAVCFYLIYNNRFGLMTEEQAFDLQLLQKILPRIQGSNLSVKRVLIQLLQMCTGSRSGRIDDLLVDASELYKPWRRSGETPTALYPQSARKLAYMLRRVEEDGFTSFWLS